MVPSVRFMVIGALGDIMKYHHLLFTLTFRNGKCLTVNKQAYQSILRPYDTILQRVLELKTQS